MISGPLCLPHCCLSLVYTVLTSLDLPFSPSWCSASTQSSQPRTEPLAVNQNRCPPPCKLFLSDICHPNRSPNNTPSDPTGRPRENQALFFLNTKQVQVNPTALHKPGQILQQLQPWEPQEKLLLAHLFFP